MSACLSILRAWIARFKQKYLLSQTLLEPYPEQLSELQNVYSGIDGKNYLK
jgi:uncharacterized protein YbgA (DUF1722 family)